MQQSNNLEHMQFLLSRFKYKKGWKFIIGHQWKTYGDHRDLLTLIIEFNATEASELDSKNTTVVKSEDVFDSDRHKEPDDFYRYLRHRIQEMEMHEVDEFIRVNGEQIFNPHKVDQYGTRHF